MSSDETKEKLLDAVSSTVEALQDLQSTILEVIRSDNRSVVLSETIATDLLQKLESLKELCSDEGSSKDDIAEELESISSWLEGVLNVD